MEDLNQISPKAYGLAVTEEADDDDLVIEMLLYEFGIFVDHKNTMQCFVNICYFCCFFCITL